MLGSILSLGAAFFWASSVVLFKKSGETISPVALNIFKSIVALILLSATMLVINTPFVPDKPIQDWMLLTFSGVVGLALADLLFFVALDRLGAGMVAIIECLYLPSVITLSCIFLGETLSNGAIIGGLLILAAVLIGTVRRKVANPLNNEKTPSISGVLIGCVAMVLVAIGIVSIKEVLERTDVVWATFIRVLAGTITLTIIVGINPKRRQYISELKISKSWIYALPASIASNYLALLCWIGGMKYSSGASQAAILNQMSTIIIFVLAAVFLKEKITANKLVAIGLAITGAYLTIFW